MIGAGRDDVAVQPVLHDFGLQVDGAHIGLDDRDLVLDVDLDDAVHSLQVKDDDVLVRRRGSRVKSGRERLRHVRAVRAEAHDRPVLPPSTAAARPPPAAAATASHPCSSFPDSCNRHRYPERRGRWRPTACQRCLQAPQCPGIWLRVLSCVCFRNEPFAPLQDLVGVKNPFDGLDQSRVARVLRPDQFRRRAVGTAEERACLHQPDSSLPLQAGAGAPPAPAGSGLEGNHQLHVAGVVLHHRLDINADLRLSDAEAGRRPP